MCAEALGTNRKNIYRHLTLPDKDQTLKQQIEAVHRQHPAYGHRRIALQLGINHKRTQRVMAKFQLRPLRRRIKRYSTVSTSPHTYHNLLNDLTRCCKQELWIINCEPLGRSGGEVEAIHGSVGSGRGMSTPYTAILVCLDLASLLSS